MNQTLTLTQMIIVDVSILKIILALQEKTATVRRRRESRSAAAALLLHRIHRLQRHEVLHEGRSASVHSNQPQFTSDQLAAGDADRCWIRSNLGLFGQHLQSTGVGQLQERHQLDDVAHRALRLDRCDVFRRFKNLNLA